MQTSVIVPGIANETAGRLFALPVLFGSYLLAKPFYIFESGLPQPADLLVCVLLVLIFFSRSIAWQPEASAACVCAVSFTLYAALISLCHAFLERDLEIGANAVYYLFNTILLAACMYLLQRYREAMLRTMLYAAASAVLIQVALSALMPGVNAHSGGRAVGFFNNPNQLGYWSLLSASLIFLLCRQLKVGPLLQLVVFVSCLYLAALSLSKAAMVSMFVLGLLHAMKRTSYAIATIIALAIIWQVATAVPIAEYVPAYHQAVDRLEGIGGQSDDNVEGRGYDRIVEYWEYLFFGAAEDGLTRFNATVEIHSTFGTVLFSYGIIGFVLFTSMILYACKAGGVGNAIYLIPAFLYGIAHQGLRFGLFYVLLAAVAYRREPPPTAAADREARATDDDADFVAARRARREIEA